VTLAHSYLNLIRPYSIWPIHTQAIKEVPLKLNKTPINMEHNTESLAVKGSNFNI
jgi:hypothetical protein